MKKFIIYICLLMPLAIQSCKKEYSPGDNNDFSNQLPPYITFRNTNAITAQEGMPFTVPLGLRTSLQQTVTVTLSITGAVNVPSYTVTVPVESTSFNGSVTIPVGGIVAPATTAAATISLVKAVTADGTALTIGANNVASAQKIAVTITK